MKGHVKGCDLCCQVKKIKIESILTDCETIPLNISILKLSRLKRGHFLSNGIITDNEDIIIGVTAEQLGISKILTKNRSHFKHFDLEILTY